MFTHKMTACLVGLALLGIATMSCSKKQSTYSVDSFPYKATLKGVVVYSNDRNGQSLNKLPMPNATVYLSVSVGGTLAKTLTEKTDASGNYQFTNIPVAADWDNSPTTLAVQVTTTVLNNYTYQATPLTNANIHPNSITPDAQLAADSINMTSIQIKVQ